MNWNYHFIDHTADIAVEVEGGTIEDLFIASVSAWQECTIEKSEINFSLKKHINIKDQSLEELLVHFLDEINFLLLTKKWILSKINGIEIKKSGDKFVLSADIVGENTDEKKHQIKVEIKAVTFHQMEIKKINNRYTTRIVFDI